MRCHVQRRRKITQTVRPCASQFVQLCAVHSSVLLIEPLAKPTDAQLFTRQSSAKQTQANSHKLIDNCWRDTSSTGNIRQTHLALSLAIPTRSSVKNAFFVDRTATTDNIQDTSKCRQKVSNNYITHGTCHCSTRYASKFEWSWTSLTVIIS